MDRLREAEEISECTFKPNINKQSGGNHQSSVLSGHSNSQYQQDQLQHQNSSLGAGNAASIY